MKSIAVYIHIPYCRSKCPYCDFFSLADQSSAQRYVEAVCARTAAFLEENPCEVETLYIGGGTPSVLEGKQIAAIIETAANGSSKAIGEITVECNPSDVSAAFFESIHAAGANRLSLGMQSAVDSERRALGRRADRAQVKAAVEAARRAGFQNISLDIMLGIPQQTQSSLQESIRFCAELGVEHVSAYILKLEEGTFFAKHPQRLALPDEDAAADLYLLAVEALEQAGWRQYEISNFAKPGFESRHNLKYWRLEPYAGIGAAAHSFLGGKRFYYPRDIDYFIAGGAPIADGAGGDRLERIMLGLRLKEGIQKALLSEKARGELPALEQQGFVTTDEQTVALTPKGCLLSNTIINLLSEV
ncbi:MAG: radical SAM family heme chaperone HemW [Clostridia bacterium]|nr:radical SAM family heme chaperone HemW [Clostridia bacterium]